MAHTAIDNENLSPELAHAIAAWFAAGDELSTCPDYVQYEPKPSRLQSLSTVGYLLLGTTVAGILTVGYLMV